MRKCVGAAPPKKKILRAFGPKDCTLIYLILTAVHPAFPRTGHLNPSGRSSDSRINLLSRPSRRNLAATVAPSDFVPVHSGGTVPEFHGIPF